MKETDACIECLRRSWLLSSLGPYLDSASARSGRRGALELLRRSDEDLIRAAIPTQDGNLLEHLMSRGGPWFEEQLGEAGCWAVCRHRPEYPRCLLDLEAPPAALFGRGEYARLAGMAFADAVAVVGSRRATSYGRKMARSLAYEAAAEGLPVVSGMAFGIDSCAHRGALDADGLTIAVMAGGPDIPYPVANRALWRRIIEVGAVISELPPGALPRRWSFPVRSRLVVALTGMTVVVEAALRSGSILTARLAAELGREVGAVPGPVTERAARGPNSLLADGASVVRGGVDVARSLRSATKRAVPAFTVVGNYGDSRSPFIHTVRTTAGPASALELARRAFDAEAGGKLDLRVDALLEGEPRLIDPTTGR